MRYSQLVFLFLASSIIIGAPTACNWVNYFGSKPLGIDHEHAYDIVQITNE
jgi:hypothetical protein